MIGLYLCQIFEGLRLTTPAVAYEAVLLTPNILTEIHTNRYPVIIFVSN